MGVVESHNTRLKKNFNLRKKTGLETLAEVVGMESPTDTIEKLCMGCRQILKEEDCEEQAIILIGFQVE